MPITTPATISVVIPCFNAERYIAAAIRSALAQDWSDIEIIVIDDGSTDRSVELVGDAFPEVKLLRQTKQGAAAARNLGIRRSHGDWIAFLDADDFWLPGKLQAQWRLLDAQPTARMAYGAWQVWFSVEASPPTEYIDQVLSQAADPDQWAGPSGWIYPRLLLDCEVWTSTVLMRRSLFEEIGFFDAALPIGEDYDLWLRASQATPILRATRPCALYRMHPASITTAPPEINYRELIIARALARWGYDSPDGGRARKADVDRAIAQSWSHFASAHLGAGNLSRAWQGGLMSIRARLWHAHGWRILMRTLARALAVGRRTRH